MTATVAVDVWIRPCDSVAGTRCTRCVPPSHLNTENAPSPLTANTASLTPPPSLSLSWKHLVEAAPLGVALEHPDDLGRPQRRLVAAHLADLDDHVLVVAGSRSTRASFSSSSRRATSASSSPAIAAPDRLRVRQVGARLPPLTRGADGRLELLQAPAEVGRLAMVT